MGLHRGLSSSKGILLREWLSALSLRNNWSRGGRVIRSKEFCLLASALGFAPALSGLELRDDFNQDPFGGEISRWQIVGDARLFRWDPIAGNLAVTWDSSRGNSFCLLSLGHRVTSTEAFAFAWDLRLTTAGPRPASDRTNALQISVALVRQSRLPDGYPQRISSGRAQDLVDFSFFPLADYGPFGTAAYVAPAVFGGIHARYSFGNPYDLTDGQPHRVRCHWDPATRRLYTEIAGTAAVAPTDPPLPAEDDFAVDALAVVVWNEGPTSHDSLLAEGTVDNIILTLPDPITHLAGPLMFEATTRTVQFKSRVGYRYQLEASGDLAAWTVISVFVEGTDGDLTLSDYRKAFFVQQFYRLRAEAIP